MQSEMAVAEWLYGSPVAPYEQPVISGKNTAGLDIAASFNPPVGPSPK